MAKARPGKYDAIVVDLKHAPTKDVPYQQKVDKVKEEWKDVDVLTVVDEYRTLRRGTGLRMLKALQEAAKALDVFALTQEEEAMILVRTLGKEGIEALDYLCNLRIEAATQLLVASQDRGDEPWGKFGVKDNAIRLENGDTIRVHAEPYGQVKDKEAFRLWCIKNGYETQLQLWPATMNAIAKERRLNGDPDPDGVEVFRKEQVKFIPAGGKDE